MNGLLIVDKPGGISSARVVGVIKRLFDGRKVGHAGTLDPFATGVLILLVGKATHKCEQIMSWSKTYRATVKLGARTATDDVESPELPIEPAIPSRIPEYGEIEAVLTEFVGDIQQRPPLYSAVKIGGKRACDRVRQGDRVELRPRTVHVESIRIINYKWPLMQIEVVCGRGTYIRSIARDLGARLGSAGYLTELRRMRIGRFGADQAIPLAQLNEANVAEHIVRLELIGP